MPGILVFSLPWKSKARLHCMLVYQRLAAKIGFVKSYGINNFARLMRIYYIVLGLSSFWDFMVNDELGA